MRKNYTHMPFFRSDLRRTWCLLGLTLILIGWTGSYELVQGQSARQELNNRALCQQYVRNQDREEPQCGLEITCSDKTFKLGTPQGVCFRATCPGIVAILHNRADEVSFRRRFFTYRHYTHRASWELKDQGLIESGPTRLRELFLVLPGDLIEFSMADNDCNASIHLRSLGYIEKGDVCELQRWLAFHRFMEEPALTQAENSRSKRNEQSLVNESCGIAVSPVLAGGIRESIFSFGRAIGLPLER